MTSKTFPATRLFAVGIMTLGLASCAGLAPYADVLGGTIGGTRQLSGEVSSVDTRRQEVRVQTGWGRTDQIRYDNRTEVYFGSRRYSPRDLERGDVIRAWVTDRGSQRYADRIQVVSSVRSQPGRGSAGNRLERVDGSIVQIDHRRGTFELRQNRGGDLLVILPTNPDRQLYDRFRRLRRGQGVRLEGYLVNRSQLQLVRIR